MAMSKKDFIALADAVREHNAEFKVLNFADLHLDTLADFCCAQNPRFMRERWLGYIRGECGSNGGQIKPEKPTGAGYTHYYTRGGAIRTRKVGA